MVEIIEGTWEDLAKRDDLRGRRLRAVVLEEGGKSSRDEWLKAFDAWVDSHAPVNHFVDDSRDSIYTGTVDDPS
jgi:hypothetical protein